LLGSGKWAVRALTRKVDSDAAKHLKNQGVEVVAADLNKAEDLERAFSGAHGVFIVTSSFESGIEAEIKQGQLAVDIAKKQNVSHFVYSSLDNSEKISGGKNKVHHFTSKAKVDEYILKSGIPATSVQIACYYENFTTFFVPKPNAEGIYEFALPIPTDSKFAIGSVADLGNVVAKVFENRELYLGKTIAVAGDYRSSSELATTLSHVWGKPVRANYIPTDVFGKFPFPHAEELADMFSWFHHFGYYGEKVSGRDVFEGKKIYPALKTFEEWAKEKFSSPNVPAAEHK